MENTSAATTTEFDAQDNVLKRREWKGDYYKPLVDLGLEMHVAELEAVGFTIVPPEKVAPPAFLSRIKRAVLRIAEARHGVSFSPQSNPALDVPAGGVPNSVYDFYLLFEDDVYPRTIDGLRMTTTNFVAIVPSKHRKTTRLRYQRRCSGAGARVSRVFSALMIFTAGVKRARGRVAHVLRVIASEPGRLHKTRAAGPTIQDSILYGKACHTHNDLRVNRRILTCQRH
ncbi:MAG: hypothetical protein ACFHX7_15515 [Pseudomonadota bacterium]